MSVTVGGWKRYIGAGAVALLGIVAALSIAWRLPAAQAAAHTGSDTGPTGKLVFSAADGLYVLDLSTNAQQRVWQVPAGGHIGAPRWSPDGSHIAAEGPDGEIWVLDANGASAHPVTHQAVAASGCSGEICDAQGTRLDSPRWSPDGTRITYRTVENAARAAVWLVTLTGGAARKLQSADDLCLFTENWSVDGLPTYSRCAGHGSSTNQTFAVDTGGPQLVLPGAQIAFSPSGAAAYAQQTNSYGGVSVSLYIDSRDGSAARLVAAGGQSPLWSRDGLLAYQVNGSNGADLHVFDPATGHDLVVGTGALAGWSSNGTWLFFTAGDGAAATIQRVRIDGTGNAVVTIGTLPDLAPAPLG